MTVLNPVSFLQNRTDHTAQVDRLAQSGLLMPGAAGNTWRAGVRGAGDLVVAAQGVPNMSVQVAAGSCYVVQSVAGNGAYLLTNDAAFTVAITAAHATLPRKDLIVARVTDSFFTGVTNLGTLEVVTGVAAASPVDPAVTGNATILARVTVPAAATTIVAGNITDLRPRAAALGGIIPVLTTAERDAIAGISRGMVVDNLQTGFLERHNGTTWKTLMEVTPWAAYTPAIVGTAAPTLDCRWQRIGDKLVVVEFSITLTAAVTATLTLATPTTMATLVGGFTLMSSIEAQDISAGLERSGDVEWVTATTVRFAFENATPQVVRAAATIPFTWASTDKLVGMFQYREA
jgi:hypothetical protein